MTKYKGNKFIIIHAKEIPRAYGNLRMFFAEHGLSYSNYVKKKFPYNVDGFPVHKVETKRGNISDYLIKVILENLNGHSEFGDHIYKIDDGYSNEITVSFHYSGGVFKVIQFAYKNKKGSNLDSSLKCVDIENSLNGSRQ